MKRASTFQRFLVSVFTFALLALSTGCTATPKESGVVSSPSVTPSASEISGSSKDFGFRGCQDLFQEVNLFQLDFANEVRGAQRGSQEQGLKIVSDFAERASALRDKTWDARSAINLSKYESDVEVEAKSLFLVELNRLEALLTKFVKMDPSIEDFLKYQEDDQMQFSCLSLAAAGHK